MSTSKLDRGAEKVTNTCLRLREGETALIVADTRNLNVGLALMEAARKAGAEVSLALFDPRKAHAEDPPESVVAAMCNVDAAVLAAVFSLSNSSARRKANAAGTRIISIPGCNEATLASDVFDVDFEALRHQIQSIGKLLSHGKEIHITSDLGTDLTVKLCGLKSVDQTALAHEPGTWAPAPNLEAAVGPCIDGVDGIFIVDGVVVPGGIPEEPITIHIEKGKVKTIAGGVDAQKLKKLLEGFRDPRIYQVVEVGIGLNPKAQIGKGQMAEDESQFGTLHLGIGAGRTFGLPIDAPSHIDLVIRKPTVAIDGRTIVSDECVSENLMF